MPCRRRTSGRSERPRSPAGLRWLLVLALLAGCSSDEAADAPAPSSSERAATSDPAGPDPLAVELSPLLGRPSAVVVHDGVVWVADDGRDVVLRLDAGDGRQLGEPVPVPPAPVALAAADGTVWVAGAGGTLAPIDAVSGSAGPVVALGGAPADVVAVDGTIWVADIERSAVIPVDAASVEPGAAVSVPAGAVRLAASAERLWVTNLESTVTAVDLTTGEVGRPTPVGNGPIGLAVAGDIVWVADGDDGTVSRIDEATSEPVGQPIAVGAAPVAVEVVGDDLWIIEQDGRSASRIDVGTGRVELRSGELGTRPRGISAGAGDTLWVVGVDPSAAVRLLADG